MLRKKYDVLVRNGKDRFVVVPEKEFRAIQARLAEDDADFAAIEASKRRNSAKPLIPHDQVMRRYGLVGPRGGKKP